jgi:hypothetical protein
MVTYTLANIYFLNWIGKLKGSPASVGLLPFPGSMFSFGSSIGYTNFVLRIVRTAFLPVFRIWIHRIHIFLGLPDPESYIRAFPHISYNDNLVVFLGTNHLLLLLPWVGGGILFDVNVVRRSGEESIAGVYGVWATTAVPFSPRQTTKIKKLHNKFLYSISVF